MRKIIVVIFAVALIAACTTIDCPVENTVQTNYVLKKPGGVVNDTLDTDTLWILTRRADGTDTLLLNELYDIATGFTLPISYTQPEDVFYTLLCDTSGHKLIDTIRIKKENYPHFESVDCQASYFHEITAVSTTHHAFDSIVIHSSYVDYDPKKEHFYLYIKKESER
jgi:hypothetical protein